MYSRLVLLTFLDDNQGGGPIVPPGQLPDFGGHPSHPIYHPGPPVDPGYGQGHPRPPYPGGGPIVPPVYPGGGPIFPPVGPDNTLPDNGTTPPPQISLPIVLPPTINPTPPGRNQKFELKYSVRFGWVIVPVSEGEIDNTLPQTPEPK